MSRTAYFLKLLKYVVVKEAVKKIPKDELVKVGAREFANILTKNDVPSSVSAYNNSAFIWETYSHQFSSTGAGISYFVNGVSTGTVPQDLIESVGTMKNHQWTRVLKNLQAEADTALTKADKEDKIEREERIFREGRAMDKAKEKGGKDEKVGTTPIVFNRFINLLLDHIPHETTTASGLPAGYSWRHIAEEVVSGLVGEDSRGLDVIDSVEDGSRILIFLVPGDENFHQLEVNAAGGIVYTTAGGETFSKGYAEIITDFEQKKHASE